MQFHWNLEPFPWNNHPKKWWFFPPKKNGKIHLHMARSSRHRWLKAWGSCFEWKFRPLFWGGVGSWPFKNRGHWGALGVYIYVYIIPFLKLTFSHLENGWLEYNRFLLGWPIFRGLKFGVSFREGIWKTWCSIFVRQLEDAGFRGPKLMEMNVSNGWLAPSIYIDQRGGDRCNTYGCFLKWWYPQIIHSNRVFRYKPSILGYPYFWNPPYNHTSPCQFWAIPM